MNEGHPPAPAVMFSWLTLILMSTGLLALAAGGLWITEGAAALGWSIAALAEGEYKRQERHVPRVVYVAGYSGLVALCVLPFHLTWLCYLALVHNPDPWMQALAGLGMVAFALCGLVVWVALCVAIGKLGRSNARGHPSGPAPAAAARG